jgi:hypothetical protein
VGARIYPEIAPATATLPFVTYQRLEAYEERHLVGLSRLTRTTYQLDAYGQTPSQVEPVALALKTALDGYRGPMGTVAVEESAVMSILDTPEPPLEGETQLVRRRTLTVNLWFRE